MDVLEREERLLEKQLENGEIDLAKYNNELRDLHNEYRWQAHKAAKRAYDDELERW